MPIAAILIPLVGQLIGIGVDAWKGSQASALEALKAMQDAIEQAKAAITALPAELAANDKAADDAAALKP